MPSTHPGPADSVGHLQSFYPDVLEQGGLAAAIVRAAADNGVEVGAASERPGSDPRTRGSAEFRPPRGVMRVRLGLGARRFSIVVEGERGNRVRADGSTAEMSEVAGVLAAWRAGAKLAELAGRFPFMEFDRLSQAFEYGNPAEVQWTILIEDDTFSDYRDLLLALRDNPRLRSTIPFFSHWVLKLSVDPYEERHGGIWIRLDPAGGYEIWSSPAPERRRHLVLGDLVHAAESLLEDVGFPE